VCANVKPSSDLPSISPAPSCTRVTECTNILRAGAPLPAHSPAPFLSHVVQVPTTTVQKRTTFWIRSGAPNHSQTQALFLSDPWRIYGSGDHQGLDSHWKKWEAHASDRVDVPQRVDLTPGKGPAPHRVRHQRRRHLHLPISEQTRTRFWGTRWSCSMRWLGWPSASTRTRKSRAHAPTQLSAVGRTCTPPPPHRTHACLCFAAAYALHLHVYARRATCARTQARATLLNIVDSTSRCTVCRPTMRACQPDPLESRRQRLNLREKTQRNTCVDFTLFSCKRAL
jgi:hypothetical protein